MDYISALIAKFGGITLFLGPFLLGGLLFFQHFGAAEKLANFFLLFALIVVSLLLINSKSGEAEEPSLVSRKFLFIGWMGVLLAVFFAFRSIFSSGPAVWGDAPYFHPDAFKSFFPEPLVWEARGRLGVVNDLYWIYPLMFVYKGLGALGLSNDLVIRLVFYFPAIFFAVLSPWLLTRYLKFSPVVSLFSVLVYSLSTYFILVVDGGQVGVALAYGLFPFSLLELYKLTTNRTNAQFFTSLFAFMLLIAADVRFAVIAAFTIIVWQGFEKAAHLKSFFNQEWKRTLFFAIAVLGLSSYWLVPALNIEPTTGSGARSGLQLISVLNPLLIFSPHWPINEFGKITPILWYFIGVPVLIFVNFFFRKTRQVIVLTFCFLLFAFLAKGESGLFGNLYSWIVDTIPLGGAFRDSTKFFAPLALFAGTLIGLTVDSLRRNIKKRILSDLASAAVFIYLLYLVSPALTQNMHGVLAKRDFPESVKVVADHVSGEKEFLRTVWFPERHPLAYHTEGKPALDAKSLVNLRPFATLNTGTLNVFNFLNNDESLEWFRLIGAKYLVFSPDSRKVNLNDEEQEDWNKLLDLAKSKKWLRQVSWDTVFPIYEVKEVQPRIFGVEKAVVVVGGDDIYDRLESSNLEFSVQNQGFIFVEDGKTEPEILEQVAPSSAILVFNNKGEDDLAFSFLQKYFISPSRSSKTEWAVRKSNDYLKWKYELLVNNIQTREFDFEQGVAFSSSRGEEINFRLNIGASGAYILAVRSMASAEDGLLKGRIEDNDFAVFPKNPGQFDWYIQDINLLKGEHKLVLENANGFQVVNTVALIPREKWLSALKKTRELTSKIEVVSMSSEGGVENLQQVLSGSWRQIKYEEKSPVEYEIRVPDKVKWVIFTDNYHKDWQIEASERMSPFPFYSAINGFYVPTEGNYEIIFSGQEKVRPGLYVSLLFLAVIAAVYLIRYKKGRVF